VTATASNPPRAARDWSVRDVVAWTTDDLRKRGIDSARVDAELIVAHALGIDRVKVVLSPERALTNEELDTIKALVKRRRAFEPVAYLRGHRDFYGRTFRVDARVLVPRPDTETLIEVALDRLRGRDLSARVIDLCTGSGCVAVTLKLERPTIAVDATDLSADAIAVARDNARRLGAVWNVSFGAGDLFTPRGEPRPVYDLVVANPPYIPTAEIATLQPDIKDHEPAIALDGGSDGLDLMRRIVEASTRWLRPGGAVALEIGAGQSAAVRAIFEKNGYSDVRATKDYGGVERVISGVLHTSSSVRT
jgi:release factor glutamine methyltransferase